MKKYTTEEIRTALRQTKELCDFMLDDTCSVQFSTTGRELDCLIEVLASLRETALHRRAKG